MKNLLNHLLARHLIPVLLLPVVLSGMACYCICGVPQAVRSSDSTAAIALTVLTFCGVLGVIFTGLLFNAVRARPPEWVIFGLGRTAWSALILAAFIIGIACGLLMMFQTMQ